MNKADVHHLLTLLPDEFEPEQLMYHLYVIARIERGEAEYAAGDFLTQEEIEAEFRELNLSDTVAVDARGA